MKSPLRAITPSVFIFSTSQSGEMYWSFVFVAIYVVVLIMQCPPLRCNLLQIKGFYRRKTKTVVVISHFFRDDTVRAPRT